MRRKSWPVLPIPLNKITLLKLSVASIDAAVYKFEWLTEPHVITILVKKKKDGFLTVRGCGAPWSHHSEGDHHQLLLYVHVGRWLFNVEFWMRETQTAIIWNVDYPFNNNAWDSRVKRSQTWQFDTSWLFLQLSVLPCQHLQPATRTAHADRAVEDFTWTAYGGHFDTVASSVQNRYWQQAAGTNEVNFAWVSPDLRIQYRRQPVTYLWLAANLLLKHQGAELCAMQMTKAPPTRVKHTEKKLSNCIQLPFRHLMSHQWVLIQAWEEIPIYQRYFHKLSCEENDQNATELAWEQSTEVCSWHGRIELTDWISTCHELVVENSWSDLDTNLRQEFAVPLWLIEQHVHFALTSSSAQCHKKETFNIEFSFANIWRTLVRRVFEWTKWKDAEWFTNRFFQDSHTELYHRPLSNLGVCGIVSCGPCGLGQKARTAK